MADAAASAATLPAPALPTLPHSLLHEICHYLWPADVARLADTCRGLGLDDGAGSGTDETAPCSPLIAHGLRFFRPSGILDADTTLQLICHRLPRLKGLRILDLSGAIMTIHAIEELGRLAEEGAFQSVRMLSFYGNLLENKGVDALGRALERGGFRNTLEGLYVRANQIGETIDSWPDGELTLSEAPFYRALIEGACRAPLRAFSLAQNNLCWPSASLLRRALETPYLKQLKKLDLHLNRLGDVGAEQIALGLKAGGGMPCLDELYLSFNGIGDEGASCVLGALHSMPAMRELDLASGLIGDGGTDAGILALASALVRAPDNDGDDDENAQTLAIETIDLRGNRLTPRAAEALLAALVDPTDQQPRPLRCPRLTAIYWDDNPAVRMPRGREALQALKAATGIAWAYADVW